MSRIDTWLSKEDILRDLGVVTGRYSDVAEDFVVRGERPPPPRRIKDEEMEYKFQDCAPSLDNVNKEPDLKGITQMLRMVSEYEDNSADESGTPNEVVTISKLNPNVPEFVPLSIATSSPRSEESEDKLSKQGNNLNDGKKVDSISIVNKDTIKCNKTKDCKEINIEKRIEITKLNSDEITDITKKLRKEISDAPNKDNLQGKRKRNVAIATLLKLYSTNSTPMSPTPDNDNKPILYTPQYFERCTANAPLEEASSLNHTSNKGKFIIDKANETKKTTNETSSSNEPSPSSSTFQRSPVEKQSYDDREIRESIEKVNNWFEKPDSQKSVSPKVTETHRKSPKPKGPIVFLEPVSFKKKANPKSPVYHESKRSTPTYDTAVSHYKPSKYAEDLTKMYTERSQDADQQILDIWTRATMEMKAKEEKMKRQLLEQSSSSIASSQDHSSQEGNVDDNTAGNHGKS